MYPKPFLLLALGALALAAGVLAPQPSRAQTTEAAALDALAAEIALQQVAVANNQAQIDAKLAIVAENVRVARLFSARGGGSAK